MITVPLWRQTQSMGALNVVSPRPNAFGDRDVERLDRDLFRSAFKKSAGEVGYVWYFDFGGDGDVDGRDNGQFNRRFGQH